MAKRTRRKIKEDPDYIPLEKPSKNVVRHSSEQIEQMEALYLLNSHADTKLRNELENLAARINLDSIQVKWWFQNRRTKEKQLANRSIATLLHEELEGLQEASSQQLKNLNEQMKNLDENHKSQVGALVAEIVKLQTENIKLRTVFSQNQVEEKHSTTNDISPEYRRPALDDNSSPRDPKIRRLLHLEEGESSASELLNPKEEEPAAVKEPEADAQNTEEVAGGAPGVSNMISRLYEAMAVAKNITKSGINVGVRSIMNTEVHSACATLLMRASPTEVFDKLANEGLNVKRFEKVTLKNGEIATILRCEEGNREFFVLQCVQTQQNGIAVANARMEKLPEDGDFSKLDALPWGYYISQDEAGEPTKLSVVEQDPASSTEAVVEKIYRRVLRIYGSGSA